MGKIRSLKQVFDEVAEINRRQGTGGGLRNGGGRRRGGCGGQGVLEVSAPLREKPHPCL